MKQILNTLYIQSQGSYLRLDHETLKVDVEGKTEFQIPLHHLGCIVAFGNVLFSPFLIHRCAEDGRGLVWMTQSGRFKARLQGPTTGNVLLRRAQHAALDCGSRTLSIARATVAAKLQNARHTLMRAAREANSSEAQSQLRRAGQIHEQALRRLPSTTTLDEIRGCEGEGGKAYFSAFTCMVRAGREAFAFDGRTRRPPRDPVNALLSFFYSLLVNECVAACEGVGLDPQMGFLHALRPGRPSLALDLAEEFRSPLADRLALTLVNRRQIKPDDFEQRTGGAIVLTEKARKGVLVAYQKRKQEEVPHTMTDSKIPFGLVPHVQARLLARHLRGDVPDYQPFVQG